MKRSLPAIILSTAILFGGISSVMAQTTTPAVTPDVATLQAQVQQLTLENAKLKAKIAELEANNAGLQGQMLQLTTSLHKGMHGEDVKKLQEVLATDKDIFSRDNISGFFGPLTEKAVEHFQKHFGITPVGAVGPMTLEKINELLKEHDASENDLSEGDLGDIGDQNDEMDDNEDNHMSTTSPSTGHGDHGERNHGGD